MLGVKKQNYVQVKGIFEEGTDYHIYKMSIKDYFMGAGIGFLICAIVSFVFFRNNLFAFICGLVGVYPALIYYKEHLRVKRQNSLLLEFRDLLEALSTSYSSGKNTMDAFTDSYQDLLGLYGEHADIVKETRTIMLGMANNILVEDLVFNFAKRSGLEDVESFSGIFESCNKYGGDLKQAIGDTRKIINDKIEVEMEIKTMVAEKENELNIMMVMPLVIMLALSGMGSMSAVSNTPVNIIAKIVVLGIFFASYKIGRKILDIRL